MVGKALGLYEETGKVQHTYLRESVHIDSEETLKTFTKSIIIEY